MGEYFECELRINNTDETLVTNVWLRILPRIGEHISTKSDGKTHRLKVTDIWHFAGDRKTGHRIIIYVNYAPLSGH
ncbi:hypothetical protein [Paenibacillus ginsengarvi]|uniref:Uncharacterized protein n=1 Tax=Paenibacillus ginsengarvi TaxID=400777 RepID=A0A3B0CRG1_9BACL|nr:hypothetical protein [Paenibacillus ginsengarvi]RKN86760.1 hypothetical protein D7M11_02035 [Paenibacillus ginsengarvi]